MIFRILILSWVTKLFVTADIQLLPTKAEDLQSLVESVKKDVDWHLQIWAERGRLADVEVLSHKKPIFSSPTLTKDYTVMNATSTSDHLQEIAEYSSDGVESYYGSVKGRPGKDFPDYTDIPRTSFTCSDKTKIPGFYADPETGCQVFHVCWPDRRESFLCPLGTIFNQKLSTCDYWYNTNCSRTSFYYKDSWNAEADSSESNVHISFPVQKTDSLAGRDPATSIMFFVSEFMPIKAKIVVYPKPTKQRPKVPDFTSNQQTNTESNPKTRKRARVSKHSRVPRSLEYASSSADSLKQHQNEMYMYYAWEALKDAVKEIKNDKSTAHLSPYAERILEFIKFWSMMDGSPPVMVKVEPGTELYELDLRAQKTAKNVQFLFKKFIEFVADFLYELDIREKDEKSSDEVLQDDSELQDLNVEPLTNLNPRFIVKPTTAELEFKSLKEILNPSKTRAKRSSSLNLGSQQEDPMRIHPETKEALLESYVKFYKGKHT